MTGLVALVFVLAPRTKTPILTYHDIIRVRNAKSVWFDCTASEFEFQMNWLKKQGATFVSIQQVLESIQGKRVLPRNAICITFADNYKGFLDYAWPTVQRLKIPVAQFVHTDFVGSKTGRPKMSWNELRVLSQSGLVTVASQTCSHPADITKLSTKAQDHELRDSKKTIESQLGTKVFALAYPNGKHSGQLAKEAKRAGYSIAFTEECQPLESATSAWLVPRYVHTKYKTAWKDSLE